MSSEPENINNDVVILEWVLLAKVSVILGVPEAACAHMETTISLLQDDHVGCELEIFIDFLEQLDNHFTGIVAPFLCLL